MERRAELDSMTELLNHAAFEKYVAAALVEGGEGSAFFMIDLDDFKQVNDTLGHPEGDRIIMEFADVLRDVFAGDALVGRMGGDEFGAFVEGPLSAGEAELKARELIERKSLLPAAGMYREAGETVLLSVGRFCQAKNFEAIPKICTVLLKRGLSVKWYILGYGDRETQIREAIQAVHMEDFVVLLGKKENPYPYIRMCDIYVQPSVYEGKCVAVREAQLLGKPVIITDFSTAHSQLRDGTDGMIAPLDFDGFTDALAALIQDNEKQEALKAACRSTDFTQYKEAEKILRFAEGRESYAEDQRHCADLQR